MVRLSYADGLLFVIRLYLSCSLPQLLPAGPASADLNSKFEFGLAMPGPLEVPLGQL